MCYRFVLLRLSFFFFFNDTATTEIYTLSLHDALPISLQVAQEVPPEERGAAAAVHPEVRVDNPFLQRRDRKSTRLNSSHSQISYAVFCLKKKKKQTKKKHLYNTTTLLIASSLVWTYDY